MRIGIDSYSYHRLLGEVRPGELDPGERLSSGPALIAVMLADGAELLSLETVFLDPPRRLDTGALRRAAAGAELALAWGHPLGLEWGARPDQLAGLLDWIAIAPSLDARLVRCVAAGPALADVPKRRRLTTTVRALREAAAAAKRAGVMLALENHADVDQHELESILELVPELMVCLDTANAIRVGDDPVALARSVAGRIAMVHLKDVAAPTPQDGPTGPASVAYGEGIVDLAGVLSAIPVASAPVCVELGHLGSGAVDERALVRQCVEWLRHPHP
jgi:3-oxoisoapionate decarboxylase